jgi:hypothetical protein
MIQRAAPHIAAMLPGSDTAYVDHAVVHSSTRSATWIEKSAMHIIGHNNMDVRDLGISQPPRLVLQHP